MCFGEWINFLKFLVVVIFGFLECISVDNGTCISCLGCLSVLPLWPCKLRNFGTRPLFLGLRICTGQLWLLNRGNTGLIAHGYSNVFNSWHISSPFLLFKWSFMWTLNLFTSRLRPLGICPFFQLSLCLVGPSLNLSQLVFQS